jgi:hypothetical protein
MKKGEILFLFLKNCCLTKLLKLLPALINLTPTLSEGEGSKAVVKSFE